MANIRPCDLNPNKDERGVLQVGTDKVQSVNLYAA